MNPVMEIDYLLVISAAAAALCGWLSWRASHGHSFRLRLLLTLLRVALVICLAVIALNPGTWQKKHSDGKHGWAVLIDSSGSMAETDSGTESRLTRAQKIYRQKIKPLEEKYNISAWTFSNGLNKKISTGNGEDISKGNTDIYKAGREIISRYGSSAVNLDGIVIMSDGRQVNPDTPDRLILQARAGNTPIYTIPLGGHVPVKDIELISEKRHYLAFAGQELDILFSVRNRNMGNIRAEVLLVDSKGKTLSTQKLALPNKKTVSGKFKVKIEKPGFSQFRLVINKERSELIAWNNSSTVGITTLQDKLNMLFLEGQPFWDSKFLTQLYRNTSNINLTAVYRISSGRFLSITSGSETGVEKSSAAGLIPNDAAGFAKYDIVVLGKGMEYLLDTTKIKALKTFMTERGGAVLFARGKPYTGNFSALSSIEPLDWGKVLPGNYKLEPTGTGVRFGLFNGLLPGPNSNIWQELPQLKRATACRRLKTFAETMMVATGYTNGKKIDIPALVSRRYGRGIVITVNIEGLWQWDFFPTVKGTSAFYRNFWLQLVHWIVMYSDYLPGAEFSLQLNKSVTEPGKSIMVDISARHADAGKNAVKLNVYYEGKPLTTIIPVKEAGNTARWNTIIPFKSPGAYLVELECRKNNGKIEKHYELVYVTNPPEESDNMSANIKLLESLSNNTGGKLVKPENTAGIFTLTENDDREETADKFWKPWWPNWLLLCLLLAFPALECFIRRRNGML